MPSGTAVVVPVKAFARAKERLADALRPEQRSALARRLAEGVVGAAMRAPWPVLVVCDDAETAAWATSLGAEAIVQVGRGLDAAAGEARSHLRHRMAQIAVVHADLARPDDLKPVLTVATQHREVTVVPDHRGDGTTVLVVPTDAPFRFSYGPGSFARHCAEATRLGLGPRIVNDTGLGTDVDVPDDLAALEGTD